MKFPSLSSLVSKAFGSFMRFPLAIILAIGGTTIAVFLANSERREEDLLLVRCSNAIVSCYLGMLLSIAATVWAERKAWKRSRAVGIQAAVLAATVLYYFLMPDHFERKTVIRWALFALALHWLIAVIAYAGSHRTNAFWQYNKNLFLRILTSLLYTIVLYLGLALALEAIDHLFNADLSYKWYLDTWIILVGIFNAWFFLSGFPTGYDDVIDYPKGLKIFTQYLLLPLLTVYMAILYVYLFKVIFTAHWPSGWVAWLVLGFSVAGILALLLIYPIRNDEKNKWINAYSRFFYFALFPLLGMLAVAIWKRVNEYGVTELRYFIIVLATWLLLTALYFLTSKKKNIQLIPFSLCLFALLASFGPWGVFAVSKSSQLHRLQALLEKNGRIREGKGIKADVEIYFHDKREISSVAEYLVSTHGYESLQPYFRQNLDSMMHRDSLMGKYDDRERAEAILKLMNIPYVPRYYNEDRDSVAVATDRFSCSLDKEDMVLTTEGLPYLMPHFNLSCGTKDDEYSVRYQLGKDSLVLSLDSSLNQFGLFSFSGPKALASDSVDTMSMQPVMQYIPGDVQYRTTLPPEKMVLLIHGRRWNGKLLLTRLDGIRQDGHIHMTNIEGYLLLARTQ